MSEEEKQDSQKTVVAFIAGLLIGGLLVWVFGSSPDQAQAPSDNDEDTAALEETNDDTANDNGTDEQPANSENDDSAPAPQPAPELPVGDASVEVDDQSAGTRVALDAATFPTDEGWIGVRDYVDGQLTGLLGVARYSKEQGLVPEAVVLQRATVAGNTYAIVFYSESGDRAFNLADDVQIGDVMSTFTAQ